MSGKRATIVALALLAALVPRIGGGAPDEPDPLWEGAGGLVLPLEADTPVRIDYMKLSFTALPPAKRTLDDPRLADQWEVSTRMDLSNSADKPCTLTLALPQVPLSSAESEPAIDHVVISLDERRMTVERIDQPAPAIRGVPALALHHRVSIDFEPGQQRRVDTLFRMPAKLIDGTNRFGFVLAGAGRFAGGEVGEARFEWRFGERVRLVRSNGEKMPWIATPPAGTKHWFFDDGRESKLQIERVPFRPESTVELAVAPVGIGAAGGTALLGEPRPIEQMSLLELELARWTYLALYGRMFDDEGARLVFEDLPWEACNPAYRVAHGRPVTAQTIDEFVRANPCSASCRRDRRRSVDPYGNPWDRPLCWYSPVHTLARTQVTDPERRERVRRLENRIRQLDPAILAPPAKPAPESEPAPAPSGCGCSAVGAVR